MNNTRNKYTRMTPNEAVAAPDADIAPRYNTAREQSEENYRAVTINQGDRVRHLRNIRKRIRGIGYKAYRGDHWSKEVRHVASKEAGRRRLQVPRLRQVVRPRRPAARARCRRRLRCDCN